EFIVVCLTVALIIVCELFNTAIEEIMNMVTTGYHPKVKIIKDVSAGAVLVSAFFSVIIGYFVFFEEVSDYLETGIIRIKRYPMHIAIIAIVLAIFAVLVLKAFSGKGTPLKGGMPSGHAAIASTITTTVALWSINTKITILCIILSVLVIQSRIEAGIHTFFEVFIGSVVGFVLTLILFLIFLG
ncbi:MAG: phosphatase PAP2 family protein, partial [Clostridiaceae bacterium]|nr:phosphatase PAP2 family protein [Clostridiaceae bacterium]